MRRLLLAVLLSFPLLAETPLGIPQIGPATEDQSGPALASNGDGFLAVWIDNRTRAPELWAARLDRDGNVLDSRGILIAAHTPVEPLAIWTGTSYLVVWNRRQDPALWGARISRDGVLVDGPRVLAPSGRPRSMATNGTHVVVGLVREGFDVLALFLTPDAEVVSTLILAQDFREHRGVKIIRTGSHFTAVWNSIGSPSTVDGVRFTIAGAIEPARVLVNEASLNDPELGFDGSDFLLITRGKEFPFRSSIRTVSGDLRTVGAPAELPEQVEYSATLRWTGSHYVLIAESSALYAMRLDRQGRLLDPNPVRIELPLMRMSGIPAVAMNGQTMLVAWSGAFEFFKPSTYDVYATRLDPSTAAPTGRTLVSTTVLRETDPILASGTANVLAVWTDDAGVLARRMRKDGSPLDAAPLRLAEISTDRTIPHAVAFNGTDYLVAWFDGTTLVTRRVRHNGALLRADGGSSVSNPGSAASYRVAVASSGTTTLLVWGSNGLRAARIAPDGTIADTNPLTITDKFIGSLDVAGNDRGQFLVTWGELESLPPTFETLLPLRVRGARITTSLMNLDGSGFVIADTPAFEAEPAAAWNGEEWFVVWTEARRSVRGRRVAANGTLNGGDIFVAGQASRPDVVWDGLRYVISWLAPGALRVGGHVVGVPEAQPATSPSLAVVGPGQVMAAYARLAREPELGSVSRAFVTIVGPPARRRAVAAR